MGLTLRRAVPSLLDAGDYQPLAAAGQHAAAVLAYARRSEDRSVLVVVPRLSARVTQGRPVAPVGAVWGDTAVELPGAGRVRELHTGVVQDVPRDGRLPLALLLADFPVALLVSE